MIKAEWTNKDSLDLQPDLQPTCNQLAIDLISEEEVYVLTPYGVLLSVMGDYGIDISHITPRMAEHLFDDLMEALVKQGYVGRKEQSDE